MVIAEGIKTANIVFDLYWDHLSQSGKQLWVKPYDSAYSTGLCAWVHHEGLALPTKYAVVVKSASGKYVKEESSVIEVFEFNDHIKGLSTIIGEPIRAKKFKRFDFWEAAKYLQSLISD